MACAAVSVRQRAGSHRRPVAVSPLPATAEASCHRLALGVCRPRRSDRMVAVIRDAASVHHAVVSQRSTRAHRPIDRGVDSDGLLSADAGTRRKRDRGDRHSLAQARRRHRRARRASAGSVHRQGRHRDSFARSGSADQDRRPRRRHRRDRWRAGRHRRLGGGAPGGAEQPAEPPPRRQHRNRSRRRPPRPHPNHSRRRPRRRPRVHRVRRETLSRC